MTVIYRSVNIITMAEEVVNMAHTRDSQSESGERAERGQRDHRLFMLWTLLRQTSTLVAKNQDRALAEHGLNLSRYITLFLVNYATKPVNPTAIASYLSQETPTVTYTLDQLEKRGLIRRTASRDSRREILLEITDEGRTLVEKANNLAWKPILDISDVVDGEGELELAFGFLLKLRNRAAELYGVSTEALDFALEHRRRDPFMFGDSIDGAVGKAFDPPK